jgi:curved DNA-binding protein CbpA
MIERVAVGPVNPPPTVHLYYDRLGLTPECRSIDIKKAFRKLALKHHPDKGGDKAFFQKLTEAYEILTSVRESSDLEQEEYETLTFPFKRGTVWGFTVHSAGEPPLTRVMILGVAEGSQGAEQGVKAEDILVEVEGVGVRGMPWGHISKEVLNEILTDPDPLSDSVRVTFLRHRDDVRGGGGGTDSGDDHSGEGHQAGGGNGGNGSCGGDSGGGGGGGSGSDEEGEKETFDFAKWAEEQASKADAEAAEATEAVSGEGDGGGGASVTPPAPPPAPSRKASLRDNSFVNQREEEAEAEQTMKVGSSCAKHACAQWLLFVSTRNHGTA